MNISIYNFSGIVTPIPSRGSLPLDAPPPPCWRGCWLSVSRTASARQAGGLGAVLAACAAPPAVPAPPALPAALRRDRGPPAVGPGTTVIQGFSAQMRCFLAQKPLGEETSCGCGTLSEDRARKLGCWMRRSTPPQRWSNPLRFGNLHRY